MMNTNAALVTRFKDLRTSGKQEELRELVWLTGESFEAHNLSASDIDTSVSKALDTLFEPFKCPPRSKIPENIELPERSVKKELSPAVVRAIFRAVPPPPKNATRNQSNDSAHELTRVRRRSSRYQEQVRRQHVNSQQPSNVTQRTFSQDHTNAGHPAFSQPEDDDVEVVDVGNHEPQVRNRQVPGVRPRSNLMRVQKDENREPKAAGPFRTAQSQYLQNKRTRGLKRDTHGKDEDTNVTPMKQRRFGRNHGQTMPDESARTISRAVFAGKRGRNGVNSSAPVGRGQTDRSKRENEESDLPEVPNVEPRLVEMIMNEMLDISPGVGWEDIAGLKFAKRCVMEAVVYPMQRPDIFTGLRSPPKGLLLFGPPGTGKTMIGRAIASKSGAKFFNISASSLMSKWVGEGEKMVRALFGVARVFQPAVVFIDEIDSLLTQRSESEQESSRRVKTEFLVQMDGAGTSREDRILVVGATNRPQELDEAARRRLVKRLYIPLPDDEARKSMVKGLMAKSKSACSDEDFAEIVKLSAGYSGSDIYALCAEAALVPIRELGEAIGDIDESCVRPIGKNDFVAASKAVRASVSGKDLDGYVEWNRTFGSFPMEDTTNK